MKLEKEGDLEKLFQKAYQIKEKYVGRKAYYRGLIEFSNLCIKDCYYCGIRKSNRKVQRFFMSKEEILQMALWAYENKYGSVTLQSGERTDKEFVDFITDVIKEIHKQTHGELGMTLCLGEQTQEVYQSWFDAGAHRYLLRIETTNPQLLSKMHPQNELHQLEKRMDC